MPRLCCCQEVVHVQVTPKFCKQYAQVGMAINEGLHQFREDVANTSYPSKETSPYKISEQELDSFVQLLRVEGLEASSSAAAEAAEFAGIDT